MAQQSNDDRPTSHDTGDIQVTVASRARQTANRLRTVSITGETMDWPVPLGAAPIVMARRGMGGMPSLDGGPNPEVAGTSRPEQLPELDHITPGQVASFILGLGGRLVSLDGHSEDGHQTVVYTFEVAGKEQAFQAPVRDGSVESIAHIFTEAAQAESELQHLLGIAFRAPTNS